MGNCLGRTAKPAKDVFRHPKIATGKKLFAVYLGGRAPKCNTELHDVVFAVGETIEATYPQLMDKWFGVPCGSISIPGSNSESSTGLEISEVDGWRIHLEPTTEQQPFEPNNGFHVIPKPVVAAYVSRRGIPARP